MLLYKTSGCFSYNMGMFLLHNIPMFYWFGLNLLFPLFFLLSLFMIDVSLLCS